MMAWCLVFAIVGVDQLTKILALEQLIAEGESIAYSSFFNLTLVYNRGISFGLLAMPQPWGAWVLTGLTSIITIGLMVWLVRLKGCVMRMSLSLVIGGAIGNLIDRIRFGHVVDFLDIHYGQFHWPAFNVADSMICVGVILLIWSQMKVQKSEEHHV